jgi:hypothetical protein
MGQLKDNILRISEEILQHLLAFRSTHPGFTFSLRERDSVQSDEKRLEVGQWFQGSYYIYVPLFSKGDSARKIKTLGFVLTFDDEGEIEDNYIEVSFKGGVTEQNEVQFHTELAEALSVPVNQMNFGSWYYEDPTSYLENLDDYVGRVYPIALDLLRKHGLESKYIVSEADFVKRLSRITEIKRSLNLIKTDATSTTNTTNTTDTTDTKAYNNVILYGPPGTGKTFRTVDKALELVDEKFYVDNKNDRSSLTTRFRKLLISDWENTNGRIAFITFHQSLSYEDFIEGIKPLPPQSNAPLQYDVVDGIFKKLCSEATRQEDFTVDVEGSGIPLTPERFEEFYFAFSTSLPSYSTATSDVVLKTKEGYKFELFKSSVNSIVVKAGLQKTNTFISLNELKAVLFENKKPIYPSYEHIVLEKILEGRNFKKSAIDNKTKNYVLIIDEINRGNISQIFGELITLIEDNKRQGSVEELIVQLPYSKKPFSVPPNLYIIGTMNTADRSVEALDTALRRRFTFEFVPPNSSLLEERNVSGIELKNLLDKINDRIAYLLDDDHRIGHSYFLKVGSIEKLAEVFSKSIIPLLKEYFYNDYGKIRMVLGEDFVTKKTSTDARPKFAVRDENFIMDRPVYTIVEPRPDRIIEALTKTMTDV